MTPLPLADLFAVTDPDRERLEVIQQKLRASAAFTAIWTPAPGWLVALSPLPGSTPAAEAANAQGLAFAEGQQLFCTDGPANTQRRLQQLVRMLRQQPHKLQQLAGDFGLLHFDHEASLSVVRACGGRVPFYLWRSGSRTAVATRLGWLVRYAGAAPTLDPLTCAVMASGWAGTPDNRSPVKGVTLLPSGSVTRIDARGKTTRTQYWNPRPTHLPRPSQRHRRERAEQLRELLLDCLDRELDQDGANLLTFSGGVDSSCLASLAAGTLGREMATWSLLPPAGPDLAREQGFINPLLDQLQVRKRWSTTLYRDTRVELLAQAPHAAFPIMHPALCSLPRIQRNTPVRVLFGGEFADAVCGSQTAFADWVAHTPAWQLLTSPGSWPRGLRTPRHWLRLRLDSARRSPPLPFAARLQPFTRQTVRDEYREWLDRRLQAAARDQLPLRYLAAHSELDAFTAMNWEACSALGIRRVFPFFHREILEWAFTCHPRAQLGPDTKQLLRQALARDVPAPNLQRADKGHWQLAHDTTRRPLRAALPEALDTVIEPAWLEQQRHMLGETRELGIEMLRVFQQRLDSSASDM